MEKSVEVGANVTAPEREVEEYKRRLQGLLGFDNLPTFLNYQLLKQKGNQGEVQIALLEYIDEIAERDKIGLDPVERLESINNITLGYLANVRDKMPDGEDRQWLENVHADFSDNFGRAIGKIRNLARKLLIERLNHIQ